MRDIYLPDELYRSQAPIKHLCTKYSIHQSYVNIQGSITNQPYSALRCAHIYCIHLTYYYYPGLLTIL